MAKVHNTSDEKQKLGQHEIHPQQSAEIPDHELEQHKQDPATKKLFDSGKLTTDPSGTGVGGAGQAPGKK